MLRETPDSEPRLGLGESPPSGGGNSAEASPAWEAAKSPLVAGRNRRQGAHAKSPSPSSAAVSAAAGRKYAAAMWKVATASWPSITIRMGAVRLDAILRTAVAAGPKNAPEVAAHRGVELRTRAARGEEEVSPRSRAAEDGGKVLGALEPRHCAG